jgi:hypothetical protein
VLVGKFDPTVSVMVFPEPEAVDGGDPSTVKSDGRTVVPSTALLRVTVMVVALMGTAVAPLEGFEAVDLKKSAAVNRNEV